MEWAALTVDAEAVEVVAACGKDHWDYKAVEVDDLLSIVIVIEVVQVDPEAVLVPDVKDCSRSLACVSYLYSNFLVKKIKKPLVQCSSNLYGTQMIAAAQVVQASAEKGGQLTGGSLYN